MGVPKNDLTERIWARLDPEGELAQYREWFDTNNRLLNRVYKAMGLDVSSIQAKVQDAKRLVSDQADALRVFAPLGWAPTSKAPVSVYRDALASLEAGGTIEGAEAILLAGWNADRRLRLAVMPIKAVAAGNDLLRPVVVARWSMIDRAVQHHEAGAYEASVPIVLAQIDGLVKDLTGNDVSFFEDNRRHEHLFESESWLFGLPESLRSIRKLFSVNLPKSGTSGTLSRHGILHGRELGYDTKMTSTKAFVLLAAVLDWALPRGRTIAEQQQREREDRYAGSEEVDESGRRLDRRGFADAKNDLNNVDVLQSVHRGQNGRFSEDLALLMKRASSTFRVDSTKTYVFTNDDGSCYWAWRLTTTGYCFGSAACADTKGVWHFGDKQPPVGGPWGNVGWHHVINDPAHPEW